MSKKKTMREKLKERGHDDSIDPEHKADVDTLAGVRIDTGRTYIVNDSESYILISEPSPVDVISVELDQLTKEAKENGYEDVWDYIDEITNENKDSNE